MENNTCNSKTHWLPYWHDTQSQNKTNIQETKPEKQQQEKLSHVQKVIFTHINALIRRVTNLLKQANLKVAFCVINTIQQQLIVKQACKDPGGIQKLKCNKSNGVYVGQSGWAINVRYEEHIQYIRTNNSTSAYAKHILENKHEYRTKKTH